MRVISLLYLTFTSPCRTNVVMNYSEVESKVREATNDDPWGPSGQQMADISRALLAWEHVYIAKINSRHLTSDSSRVRLGAADCSSALANSLIYISLLSPASDRYDSGGNEGSSRGKWDEDWKRDQGQFPFSEKLGEISDKIGSTIDDTINKFKKQSRDDSPDRFSDNEEERGRPSQNGQSGRSVFKDEEETVTTKSVQIVQATETTATKKRGGVPSKTVSLGAAAHYTGDKSPDTSAKQVTSWRVSGPVSGSCHNSLIQVLYACLFPDLIGGFADFSSPAASVGLSTIPASSGNGDFGDWNAFPGGQAPVPTPFAQPLAPSNTDLFGALSASSAPAPASADLFDLMGPGQTQSLSASQSLTLNMTNTQTISSTMPQSRSLLMGGPLQPQQQQVMLGTQGSMGSAIPSTWSDSSVNISLDFLAPGVQPPKPVQPTLNTLQGGQPLPPVNMLSQGFAGMGLAPAPIRPATTPMMHPGAGMGMAHSQGMMGMGMNMVAMPQANMTMGIRMPAMSMGSGMVQQHDAFADFCNFRK
uniref:Clathrin interactor 1a n=1 Tax=Salmo trutta TaxID=8032 RepID=A0A673W1E6_SALTR